MSNERFSEVDAWKTNMFLYNAALKEVGTKIEILNEEFLNVHKIIVVFKIFNNAVCHNFTNVFNVS